ncbi:type IV secretion system protein [Bartonella rattimassiliensis]|uniref:Uncharacterized protein n=1 Tax=Bartonella rattimassiliensis 15908 TaxID=1094556 RepID=J0ZG58_9HYPH|nr:type IV secretion system protein [Bartonella rattimassiliensis]EJF87068.1 hypothetical protein MCY_00192 [Bartonella rattimassiliensis 15908]
MKKLIIIIAIGVFLGTPSLAKSNNTESEWIACKKEEAHLPIKAMCKNPKYKNPAKPQAPSPTQPTSQNSPQSSSKNTSPTAPASKSNPVQATHSLETLEKHYNDNKALRKILEKIYGSITGNRDKLKDLEGNMPYEGNDFFLQKPENIYKENKHKEMNKDIPKWITEIKQEEERRADTIDNLRESISKRSDFLGIVDKAISWQAFENAKNRFDEIKKLEEEINETDDMKEIAHLQTYMKLMSTKLQNEITKLQMVSYSSDAEHLLQKRQKRQHNIKVLGRNNKTIPQIRPN